MNNGLMTQNLIKKVMANGKLLEISRCTDSHTEYLTYFYNNRFYRIEKEYGEIVIGVRITKSHLSEYALYNLSKGGLCLKNCLLLLWNGWQEAKLTEKEIQSIEQEIAGISQFKVIELSNGDVVSTEAINDIKILN